jgi:pyruvate kinase
MRATKIVATLGPSSSDEAQIAALSSAGANVFRLNFSHGTHDEHKARIAAIRAIEAETGKPVGIIADLQGPKYRIGSVSSEIDCEQGSELCFALPSNMEQAHTDHPDVQAVVPLPHDDIFAAIMPKARLLIDDGKLGLTVTSVKDGIFIARTDNRGRISSKKGVNLPDTALDITPLTSKDRDDLAFALKEGVDFIALSFVQCAKDVIEAKTLIGKQAQIIAKIEKPMALKEIDDIISATDAVMVARGDLGVELPAPLVPSIQKNLVAKCRRVGKPVIVATQMLESMINAPSPTRAEASDVAGAVFDGADAVMLSAETAAGQYPVESVSMMAAIASAAEEHIALYPHDGPARMDVESSVYHAVAEAAVRLAETIDACAIIAFTASGNTAVRLARERPKRPILVLSPSVAVERQLSVLWGTQSCHQAESSYEDAVNEAVQQVYDRKLGSTGQSIVLVSGMPFGLAGTTNALRVVNL